MKVEILAGGNIEKAFKELGIKFNITYRGETYRVCEIDKQDVKMMEDSAEWASDWGWWCFTKGSNMGTPCSFFTINGQELIAWDGVKREDLRYNWDDEDDREKKAYHYSFKEYEDNIMPHKYDTLTDYMGEELGASTPKNVCALAVDLAKANGMTMSKLFRFYEG